MSDIILTGLKLNTNTEKDLLKPLNIKAHSITPTTINNNISKDTFSKNTNLPKLNLMNPISFFESELKTNNTFQSGNTIIEGNISSKNISAVKNIKGNNWIGKLESNGNREVAILIPPNSDINKPYEIIFYFHGHNGQMDNILSDSNTGLKSPILNKAKDKNIIVVVPQGPKKELDYTWMNGKYNENMSEFQKETINIIKTKLNPQAKIESITVAGHSAGGRPILNASREGKIYADKINFFDSTYGNWASETYKNIKKENPNTKFNVVYIKGTQTQSDALNLQGKNGVKMYTSSVNHGLVPKNFFGI